ncbi:bifunctional UDP-sugar hydrolase/5'-nucleotidase [uncultured Treponema sp.]|uniref:bifunctional metallophosphatase/5'-nucleotidase n=1 Tax=uncultured Treponema sp. TaxID=162155 RepID=UPI0025EF01B8|nr:bifunctional UDP-sugar hydrolase/5'-nucleotidase [uncultured Treponema sp.]
MKKRFVFMAAIAGIFAAIAVSCASTKAAPTLPDNDIVILYTNDVHCGLDDNIGYAGLSLYKKEMKEVTPYVSLVDAGDAIQGSPVGSISEGGYIIEIMNALGYEVAVPGNHEYDYGMKRFNEIAKALSCGYISCNARDEKGKLIFPAYKILSYGKTKVAFVGVSTPENITKSTPGIFKNTDGKFIYSFGGENKGEAMFADVQNAINEARKKGADYVILLAHLGEKNVTPEWSAESVVANTTGADVLIDGHSHEITPGLVVNNKEGKPVTITQTGTKLNNIGKLTIAKDGAISVELINSVPQKDGVSVDMEIKNMIDSINEKFAAYLGKKVGESDFSLVATDENGKWLVRNRETNLSDFVADAFRSAYKTDISLVNGGGIRKTVKAGDITYGDVFSLQPFGNRLCVCEISGQALLDELEFGIRLYPQMCGGMLQVSGVTYKVNANIPSSVKTDENSFFTGVVEGEYRVRDVMVNGEPLDLNKTYTVAGTAYVLRENGDGHKFEGLKALPRDEYMYDRDAVAAYFESFSGKIPESYRNENGQGRIVFEQ